MAKLENVCTSWLKTPDSRKWKSCLMAVSESVKKSEATSLYESAGHPKGTRSSTKFFSNWVQVTCTRGLGVQRRLRGACSETPCYGRGRAPQTGHDVHHGATHDTHGKGLERPQALGRHVPHAPLRQALVQVVEQGPGQAAQRPKRREEQELPDTEVGLAVRRFVREFPEGEHLRAVRRAPQVLGRPQDVQRVDGDHAAEEGAPRQLRGPEGGTLLQGEQDPADGRAERRRHARRRAAGHEVPLLRIRPEFQDARVARDAEEPPRALGQRCADDGPGVDHGPLLAHGQRRRYRK